MKKRTSKNKLFGGIAKLMDVKKMMDKPPKNPESIKKFMNRRNKKAAVKK